MFKLTNKKLLAMLAFFVVFIIGVVANLRAQISPLLQSDFDISYSKLGFALSFFAIGSFVSTFLGGVLIEKYGLRKVLLGGLLINAIGYLNMGLINSYLALIITVLIVGIGIATLNIFATSLAAQIFIKDKGKMMNVFHFFYGLGSVLSPLYANLILGFNLSWGSTYVIAISFLGVIFLFTLKVDFPKQQEKKEKSTKLTELFKDFRVLIFTIIFFVHTGTELGIKSWLSIYLTDMQGRVESEVGFYLAIYFSLFTAGRLLGSFIVERVGYLKMVVFASMGTILFISLGVVGPDYFAIFFSLAGATISINFPTLQAAMFDTFDKNISAILGLTMTSGSLGATILGDWGIGLTNEYFGLQQGMLLPVVYSLVLLGLIHILQKKIIA